MLVLDSGGLSRLAERTTVAVSLIRALRSQGLWPPIVPSMVLIESLQGDGRRDANTHRFLKMCIIETTVDQKTARRAAELRGQAQRGSAVDALVIAVAEPGATVLTGDRADIEALATYATDVDVEVI